MVWCGGGDGVVWCGVVMVWWWWCYRGVVMVWYGDGGVVVVWLWWFGCGGLVVVVWLWWIVLRVDHGERPNGGVW